MAITSGIINTKFIKLNSIVYLLTCPFLATSFKHDMKLNLKPSATYDQQFYDSIEPHATDLYLNSFITENNDNTKNRVSLQSFCEQSRMHDKTGTSKIVRLDFTGKDQLLHRTQELVSNRQTKRIVVKYEQYEFIVKVNARGSKNYKKIVKILWNDNSLKKRHEGYKKRYENRIESKKWVVCGKNPILVVKNQDNY